MNQKGSYKKNKKYFRTYMKKYMTEVYNVQLKHRVETRIRANNYRKLHPIKCRQYQKKWRKLHPDYGKNYKKKLTGG